MRLRKIIIITLALFIAELPGSSVQAATLNKTAIIPQSETTYNGISGNDIEQYLRNRGSQLADYSIPKDFNVYYPTGKGQWEVITVTQEWQSKTELEVYHGKTVAQLLAEWSSTSRPNRGDYTPSPGQINPLVMLATMDKESGGVNGAYRTNLISEHPITLSWLMGYGFDGRMANCVNTGDCDINNNRNKALYYGGPGQQIAEAVSAIKRWSTTPTPLNSCGPNNEWNIMNINGECLHLENGITYALYRYTPNFSGNQLFINVYQTIKDTFNYTPPPPPDRTGEDNNDTAKLVVDTYNDSVTVNGSKSAQNRVYEGGRLVADLNATTWQNVIKPPVGSNTYTMNYIRGNGELITTKQIVVNRHKQGDINFDSKVDILDLSILADFWGQQQPRNPMVKLSGNPNEEVNILDLSVLASNWTD